MTEPLKSTESFPAGDDTGRASAIAPEPSREHTGPSSPDLRESLGRLVHATRCSFGAALDRPFTPAPWEERHPRQQELDMRIGEAVAAAERERITALFGSWVEILMSEPNAHPPSAWKAGFADLLKIGSEEEGHDA